MNLEALESCQWQHVPMASLKRGLGVNFTIATRSNFKKLFTMGVKKKVTIVQTTHLFYD